MKINKNISRGRGRMAVSGRTLVALKKKNSCVYPDNTCTPENYQDPDGDCNSTYGKLLSPDQNL